MQSSLLKYIKNNHKHFYAKVKHFVKKEGLFFFSLFWEKFKKRLRNGNAQFEELRNGESLNLKNF